MSEAMEKNKKSSPFPVILIFVFIFIFLCGGSLFAGLIKSINSMDSDKYDKENSIIAVISEIDEYEDGDDISHDVYVDYEYNGIEYTHVKSNLYVSTMYEGEKMEIYVNPDNPEDFVFKDANKMLKSIIITVGIVVGIVLILFIVIIVINGINRGKQKELHGEKNVVAVIKNIKQMYESSEENPEYVIYCQYIAADTGVIYNFERSNIPEHMLQFLQPGKEVSVTIYDGDFGKYKINI